MTDFHTHILPGIDDGSRDIDMTARMLQMEKEQGVTHVFATPHFYAHRISVQQFTERRQRAVEKTQQLIASADGFPQITAGAEVYYFSGIGRAEQLPALCIEGTDMLLLELPFAQWDDAMYRDVKSIIDRRQLQIVLAHVERYTEFQKDKSAWSNIMALPLTVQLNAGSFIAGGLHGRRRLKFCLGVLNERESVIIGSDCHNLSDRRPNLAEARVVIEKKAGADRLMQIDIYTDKLLGIGELKDND